MKAKNFGKNLKEILDILDISGADLAKQSGLTPAAVSQIINGKREPSLGTIVSILNCVPVKFERLLK